jgi:hypothetical protein
MKWLLSVQKNRAGCAANLTLNYGDQMQEFPINAMFDSIDYAREKYCGKT